MRIWKTLLFGIIFSLIVSLLFNQLFAWLFGISKLYWPVLLFGLILGCIISGGICLIRTRMSVKNHFLNDAKSKTVSTNRSGLTFLQN